MDIRQLKLYGPLMHSLQRCPNNACRNILLSHLDEPAFNYVTQWMKKSIYEPEILSLPPQKLAKLKRALQKDRHRLKYITRAGGSLRRKRKIVEQSGEGVGVLIGILAPIVIEAVRALINKNKSKKK